MRAVVTVGVVANAKGLIATAAPASCADPASCAASASCAAWRQDPHLTPFQQKVYDAVCRIPPGHVVTYKSLAESIDCRSCQAVGQALRRNPYAPTVPCHRVVKTDLTLGGYFGHTTGPKLAEKRALLRLEGVWIDDSTGKIDHQSVYIFNDDTASTDADTDHSE